MAILYPTRAGLADAVRRLQAIDWPLRQLTDHGTHEAIYVSDPDGNDLELYWDRPQEEWPLDADGRLRFVDGEIDLADLLAAAGLVRAAASRAGAARAPSRSDRVRRSRT